MSKLSGQKNNFLNIRSVWIIHNTLLKNYVKIISLDEGLIQFKMYPFQKEMIGTFHKNRFTICKLPRQSGKSTIMISYLLHYALFNPSVNMPYPCKQVQLREIC